MKIIKKEDIQRYFKSPSKIPIVRLRQVEHALKSRPKPEVELEAQPATEIADIQPPPLAPAASPWVIRFERGAGGRIDAVQAQRDSSGVVWLGTIQRNGDGGACLVRLSKQNG